MFRLATIARSAGVQAWAFDGGDGRNLRQALLYLAPFIDPSKPWRFQL